ncbi:hypothetical protein [Sporosarcina ureae]|nr:hypothetical protein [Sporosarcina ureae]
MIMMSAGRQRYFFPINSIGDTGATIRNRSGGTWLVALEVADK